jgi:hypothetical protein
MPYRPLAGGIDQTADRIVKRLNRRMGDIDHHGIGFGARRDPPEIVAAERAAPPIWPP